MLKVVFPRVVMLRVVFSTVALCVVLMAPPVAAQQTGQATVRFASWRLPVNTVSGSTLCSARWTLRAAPTSTR